MNDIRLVMGLYGSCACPSAQILCERATQSSEGGREEKVRHNQHAGLTMNMPMKARRGSYRQRLRQRLGFFAEDTITEYFRWSGTPAASHNYCHLEERPPSEQARWRKAAARLQKVFPRRRASTRAEAPLRYLQDRIQSNEIELVRLQGRRVILSEVKAQYGPQPDGRVEFTEAERARLLAVERHGLEASVIHFVALPSPRFAEASASFILANAARSSNGDVRYRVSLRHLLNQTAYVPIPREWTAYEEEWDLMFCLENLAAMRRPEEGRPITTSLDLLNYRPSSR